MELRPPEGLNSRDKILWAAATMLGEEPPATPSVRAVAARAGVSTGSVQHHFPTQRELMDEVLVRVYDTVLGDDSVRDRSIPARDRLVACLQRLLVPAEADRHPRDMWAQVFDRYIRTAPTDAAREEYVAIERELRRRIEYCLTVLQDEGALAPGDNERRARFLYTVVSGLSIAQALPAEPTLLQTEIDVLRTAADHVLNERPSSD
ncbi:MULTISPECIES: TetR/AcrR family transcriptional regulator [unclassified Nocardiopsis]|uniref:TetR/AcrR family transcriptional regulator n=1 Tax=Nocardiopsis TaxID=2013 RepID=UPI00387B4A2F